MHVVTINTLDEFDRLRPAWDELHAADPSAPMFVSWPWLRGWFEASPYGWSVLAVRDSVNDNWVAFFPISVRGSQSVVRLDQVREVHFAGNPVADYNGMVCKPELEDSVIRTLSSHILDHMRWDLLQFKDIADPRIDRLAEHLKAAGCGVRLGEGLCCPYIKLPPTWEDFLSQHLSYESRSSLRRKLRKAEKRFTFGPLNDADPNAAIAALMQMAVSRTREEPDPHLNCHTPILTWCVKYHVADVFMLRDGNTPVAGIAAMIDPKTNAFGSLVTAFDESLSEFSPGRVVNALWIKYAIEHGIRIIDFLRGEESYKFQFGAEKKYTRHVWVYRQGVLTKVRFAMSRLRDRMGI
ncbi:MAG TPA: GNAT family N-acetyltransferase [Phycisphaerales bacterium]|nr:GNAT family N-acetyltransferase [Phycisphaerales bacterium]